MCIALAFCVIAGVELRSGQLTRLLGPPQLEPATGYALSPAGSKPLAKVRAIVDTKSHPSIVHYHPSHEIEVWQV